MSQFNPAINQLYRMATERHAATAGITSNRRTCSCCGEYRLTEKGCKTKPRFVCLPCVTKASQ